MDDAKNLDGQCPGTGKPGLLGWLKQHFGAKPPPPAPPARRPWRHRAVRAADRRADQSAVCRRAHPAVVVGPPPGHGPCDCPGCRIERAMAKRQAVRLDFESQPREIEELEEAILRLAYLLDRRRRAKQIAGVEVRAIRHACILLNGLDDQALAIWQAGHRSRPGGKDERKMGERKMTAAELRREIATPAPELKIVQVGDLFAHGMDAIIETPDGSGQCLWSVWLKYQPAAAVEPLPGQRACFEPRMEH